MVKITKLLFRLISVVLALLVSPFLIISGFLASKVNRFSDFSLIVAYIPFYFGEYSRYFYYKTLLKSVGNNVIFKFGSFCQYRNTKIGNNVLIGYFNALGEVEIGNDVLVGGYVNFTSGLKQHSFDNPTQKIREQPGERKTIIVGSDVWIGNNAVICANVGDRSVVGAQALVIDNLSSNGVYVGSPAKLVKTIE